MKGHGMMVVSLAIFGGNFERDGVHKGDDGIKERIERGIDILGDLDMIDTGAFCLARAAALPDRLDIDLGKSDALTIRGILDDGEAVCLVFCLHLVTELAGDAVGGVRTGAGLGRTAEALDIVLRVAVGLNPLHRSLKTVNGLDLSLGRLRGIAVFHLYFLFDCFLFLGGLEIWFQYRQRLQSLLGQVSACGHSLQGRCPMMKPMTSPTMRIRSPVMKKIVMIVSVLHFCAVGEKTEFVEFFDDVNGIGDAPSED